MSDFALVAKSKILLIVGVGALLVTGGCGYKQPSDNTSSPSSDINSSSSSQPAGFKLLLLGAEIYIPVGLSGNVNPDATGFVIHLNIRMLEGLV